MKRAASLLDRPAPADYVEHWTQLLAAPLTDARDESESAIVFRLGKEWLGIPTSLCVEVAPQRRIQSIPHRARELILGLASVRGELIPCVSLAAILRVTADTRAVNPEDANRRLVVAAWKDGPVAFPVDEIRGVHRFGRKQLRAPPATVSQSATTFSVGVLAWEGLDFGLLDGEALRHAIQRALT